MARADVPTECSRHWLMEIGLVFFVGHMELGNSVDSRLRPSEQGHDFGGIARTEDLVSIIASFRSYSESERSVSLHFHLKNKHWLWTCNVYVSKTCRNLFEYFIWLEHSYLTSSTL